MDAPERDEWEHRSAAERAEFEAWLDGLDREAHLERMGMAEAIVAEDDERIAALEVYLDNLSEPMEGG